MKPKERTHGLMKEEERKKRKDDEDKYMDILLLTLMNHLRNVHMG